MQKLGVIYELRERLQSDGVVGVKLPLHERNHQGLHSALEVAEDLFIVANGVQEQRTTAVGGGRGGERAEVHRECSGDAHGGQTHGGQFFAHGLKSCRGYLQA